MLNTLSYDVQYLSICFLQGDPPKEDCNSAARESPTSWPLRSDCKEFIKYMFHL